MNSQHLIAILLVSVLVLFLILNKYNLEGFDSDVMNVDDEEIYYDESGNISGIKTKYMGKLDYNNKVVAEFCQKLNNVDEPNEHNLLFKDFADKLILKKKKVIENLKTQIEELQKDEVVSDLKKINNFDIIKHDNMTKQLEIIQKSKNALSSNNKVKLNVF
jgi:hypothetical protein